MRISSINNVYNFKSNDRMATAKEKVSESEVKSTEYSNYTTFFRDDLVDRNLSYYNRSWRRFIMGIVNFFNKAPKVNVYDFACSDGSEPYSLALGLLNNLGNKKSDKFFPIKAYDFDKEIISVAKSDKIPCNLDDVDALEYNTRKCHKKEYYNLLKNNSDPWYPYAFAPNDELKSKVDFNEGDIRDIIPEMEDKNNLVLCRNFLSYLDIKTREEIIDALADKLDETSLLIIGNFDKFEIMGRLEERGFVEIYKNVYRKKPNAAQNK